jgi:hypothetical protein
MNPVLAKHHPEWFAEIQKPDESLLAIIKTDEEIFGSTRSQVKFLKDAMETFSGEIARSTDATVRLRWIEQSKIIEAYSEFLRRHELFDPSQGHKLLDWLRSNGNPAITIFELERAYRALIARPVEAEPEPPTITKQPESISIVGGELATFSVEVSGSKPFTYQWIVDGSQPIPGATLPRYQTVATEYSDQKLYCCRIENKFGSIMSVAAILQMIKP